MNPLPGKDQINQLEPFVVLGLEDVQVVASRQQAEPKAVRAVGT